MDDTANDPRLLWTAAGLAALGLVSLGVLLAVTVALRSSSPSARMSLTPTIGRYQVPVTSKQPSRGATSALVTIVEWCDLGSRACREADVALQSVLTRHPQQVRWVHRHLAQRRSPTSQWLHQVAEGVHLHSHAFWEFRARVLATNNEAEISKPAVKALVDVLPASWPAIDSGFADLGYAQAVNADAIFAWRLGVSGGLGIFVNGRRIATGDPAWRDRLQDTVEEEMAIAQALVAEGVALDDVYDTLTQNGYSSIDEAPHAPREMDFASR